MVCGDNIQVFASELMRKPIAIMCNVMTILVVALLIFAMFVWGRKPETSKEREE